MSTTPNTPRDGYQIILDHFRSKYRPKFKRNTSIFSAALGREVRMGDATFGAGKALIDELAAATNAPLANGAVKVNALPQFFNTWSWVAWRDLLDGLQEEEESGAADGDAADDFRQLVTGAMLSMLTLQVPVKDAVKRVVNHTQERRSVVRWAERFARPGDWGPGQLRTYELWSRYDTRPGGELVLVQIQADSCVRDSRCSQP